MTTNFHSPIFEKLQSKTVMVTGGTGMIGANLVYSLVQHGLMPVITKRSGSDKVRLAGIHDCIKFVNVDLTDSYSVEKTLESVRPDVIFHLASSFFNPPTLSALDHMKANAIGTLNLLEAAVKFGASKMIYSGSASVYSGAANISEDAHLNPETAFGASKATASIIGATYARMHDFPFIELRVFSAFGPWERKDRLIPYAIYRALDGYPVDIGHGEQQRDFVFVEDIIDAFLKAAIKKLEPGEVINLSSGRGYAIRDVVKRVLNLMGNPVELQCGVRDTSKDVIWEISGNTRKARSLLDWEVSTSLNTGILKTIEWIKNNRDVAKVVK